MELDKNGFRGYFVRMEAGAKNKFRIDGNVVWIKLTQGKETCVDLADWPKVAPFRWFAHKCRSKWRVMARPDRETVVYMHRLILSKDGLQTDHKDGDGLNNCRSNLRLATHAENQRNRGRAKHNTSGYKGVHWEACNRKWRARIRFCGRTVNAPGLFTDPKQAALVADALALKLHGSFARLNFPVSTAAALESQ